MGIAEIISLIAAAGPAIQEGITELIKALRDGVVSHEDVLAQLAAAKAAAGSDLDKLREDAKEADKAADEALHKPESA